MSRKLLTILTLCAASAHASPTTLVSSTVIAPTPPRSLEDTLRRAEAHPNLMQAQGEFESASGSLRAARANRWFTVTGDAAVGVQHYIEPGNKGTAGVGEAGLSLFQPLVDGGRRRAEAEGAAWRQTGAGENLAWQARLRRYQAAESHIQLWLAQELAKTSIANQKALAMIASTTLLRLKQGEATKTEYAEVESRAATARALQAARVAEVGVAQANYIRGVGDSAVNVAAPGSAPLPLPTVSGTVSPTHPLIAQALAERDEAAARVKQKNAAYWPTLDLRGRTQHNAFDGSRRDQGTTLSQLTLNLGYKFIDHGVTAGEAAAAKGDLYASAAALQAIELDVRAAHNAAQARQSTAALRVSENQEALEQSAKAADTLMQEVRQGNRPLRDLLDARRDQLTAYDDWLRAYADQILSAYDLQRWE